MAWQTDTSQLQTLLDRASAGRSEAYEELVALASDRLLKLTRKMLRGFPKLGRWEATDDVLQTASLRLYQSLSDVRPESVRDFFGLAAAQIRRTLIDLARHHYGPQGHAGQHHTDGDGKAADDNLLKQQPAEASEPEDLEAWTHFHELVEQLPDRQREVFELLWYAGLKQREAADLLTVSVATIQRRWYQAQSSLGRRLRDDLPASEG